MLTVNNPTDATIAGELSLRDAVAQADTDAAAGVSDTIQFDPGLGGQTIQLTQGSLELSGAGAGTITIDGSSPSQPVTLVGKSGDAALVIDGGVSAAIDNLNIENSYSTGNGGAITNAGMLAVSNSYFTGDHSALDGGAIANTASLTLDNDTFYSNGASQSGGALYNNGGVATVADCTFSDNQAIVGGGAVENDGGGTLTIANGTFLNDTCYGTAGGAIENVQSTLNVMGSMFGVDDGPSGGAIENNAGTLTLATSAIWNGEAYAGMGNGGAIDNSGNATVSHSTIYQNNANGQGAAIDNRGTLHIDNSTLFGNSAGNGSGGIENAAGALALANVTISGNRNYSSTGGGGLQIDGGSVSMQNSILAGNYSGSATPDVGGALTADAGYNLLGTAVNNATNDPTVGPGDVFNDSPQLSSLGNYGGTTETLVPLAGSPAIGAGHVVAGLATTDERGLQRVVAGSLDIGAVQTQPATLTFSTGSQTFTAGQTASITLELEDLDGQPSVAPAGGLTVNLATTSGGGALLQADGSPLVGGQLTIPAGASSVTFAYRDSQPGRPTISASTTGFAASSQLETVLPAAVTNTPTTDLVVGRVLSAYFAGSVQNGQVTITYTVYNQSIDAETGVLLTDTLAPGVTLVSATQQPDANGQNLAWSLGTIQPGSRASVSITVSLANSAVLVLDAGAQAYATLNGLAISNITPAASLTAGNVDPNLLASTPDANTTDPFIQEEAAALDYNPQNIFSFLHNDIGYNSYSGSLRGARGTLWSGAGDSLDVASLGVALMRASGIPAQYVQGSLAQSQAQQLILSMFPDSYQTVGYVPAGTTTSDPANQYQLENETETHYWFQFDDGTGLQNADPLMSGATVGQAFTAPTGQFAEVPQSLRQTTEIQVTAEIYSQASAALSGTGNGLSGNVVQDLTFNDVELVGRPLTFGNLVSTNSLSSLTFSATTNTYTPYLELTDDAELDSNDEILMTGQTYQEVLTNVPLSNQILTGLFVGVTLGGANLTPQSYQDTIIDRLGPAARDGLATPKVSVNPTDPPIVSQDSTYTIDVAPSAQDSRSAALLTDLSGTYAAAVAAAVANGSSLLAAQVVEVRDYYATLERLDAANYFISTDFATARTAALVAVAAYPDQPQILISAATDAASGTQLSLDLLRDQVRAIAAPGQSTRVVTDFLVSHGYTDSLLEAAAVPVVSGATTLSTAAIFQAAVSQGIGIIMIGPANLGILSTLNISDDAKALISAAVGAGNYVVVPTSSVSINGAGRVGWYVINSTTGAISDELDDGTHDFFEYVWAHLTGSKKALQNEATREAAQAQQIAALNARVKALEDAATTAAEAGKAKQLKAVIAGVGGVAATADAILAAIHSYLFPDSTFQDTIVAGVASGLAGIAALLAVIDPPLPGFVVVETPPPDTTSNNTETAAVNVAANIPASTVSGIVPIGAIALQGSVSATWSTNSTVAVQASSLSAASATIKDSHGNLIGSGLVTLSTTSPLALSVGGSNQYSASGSGSFASYAAAEGNLGISANWNNYSATVSGNAAIALTTDQLSLDGTLLPAGTYTITTTSAIFAGSGQTTSPTFAGSLAMTASNATVWIGPGTGAIQVAGAARHLNNGLTVDNFLGSLNLSPNAGSSTTLAINGAAANALLISDSSPTITTDANTSATFQAVLGTSLADTYSLTATGPAGWTVTVDASGNVSATPAPGVQAGTYPLLLTATSSTDPNLVANALVNVTVTLPPPGMTLAVNPDSQLTIPFDGAQVPTAYQAVIHNTGPTADTYQLTFPTAPAGFTIQSAVTSVTVPAGQTGIVGIYLVPSGALPAPGTAESFSVTATSASGAESLQTATVDFAMPSIAAVTLTDNPTALSTTPGTAVATQLTITNVGNVPYDAAVTPTLPAGWTISGGDVPVSLAVGSSTTETVMVTPPANAPLNSTQNVTLTFGQAAAQNTVSVLSVTPSPSTVEADTQVDVAASILTGVTAAGHGSVSYTVSDSHNNVVFTSTAVPLALNEVIGVTNVNLGTFDTTGLAPGSYTLNVSVYNSSNQPIAGATAQGQLLVAAPVTVSQSLNRSSLEPGSSTVTTTLSVAAQSLLGQTATDSAASSVVTAGNYAYLIGSSDVSIVDISNPASPTVVGTFGSGTLGIDLSNLGALAGNNLVVVSDNDDGSFNLLVYSLANPTSPTLLSTTTINYQFLGNLFVQGTTAFVTTTGTDTAGSGPSTVSDQYGDFLAIDLSNPASPVLASSLVNSLGSPEGGASNINGAAAAASSLAYLVGSTSAGSVTQTGSGQLQVVDTSNPASLNVTDTLSIPGTLQALAVALQGNRALVVGSSGGWQSPFSTPLDPLSGNLTLTLLDITNPANPSILSSLPLMGTTVSNTAVPVGIISLGGGQFAVSNIVSNGTPAVLVVDSSNSASPSVTTFTGAGSVGGMAVAGGNLLASTAAGLDIYQAGSLGNIPVTVTVTVPTTTGVSIVPGSFNVAPTTITTGTTSETLVWTFPSLTGMPAAGIVWQSSISGLQVGQALPVTLGAQVQYSALGATNQATLPPLVVAGVPDSQTLILPVQLAVPGAVAIGTAAAAANQIGNSPLAAQLGNLQVELTNLFLNPTSQIDLGEVISTINSLISLVLPDPFLAPYATTLSAASSAFSSATTAGQIDTAIDDLGTALTSLAQALVDEAAYGFQISLVNSFAQLQPGSPTVFTLQLTNTGSQTATYDLSIPGLPAGVTATFSQPSITLAPGASIPVGSPITVSLSENLDPLMSATFNVVATAEQAAEITAGTTGHLQLRTEVVLVGAVNATPPYTAAGGTIDVHATLLSAVNGPRQYSVSYTVTDVNGNLLFTSTPVTTTLDISSSSTNVDLGSVDTTSFADGTDTITITAVDQSSQPLPTSTGTGRLIVGLPVNATLSVSPSPAPTGDPTVTSTLQLTSTVPLPSPLTLEGQVSTTPATTVTLYTDATHNLAYVSGPNGIDIVDVSDPTNPVDDGTFGSAQIVQGGLTVGRVDQINGSSYLIVGSTPVGILHTTPPFSLLIYSLADPLAPSLVSDTSFNYGFLSDMVVEGNTVLVPVESYFLFGGIVFEDQSGNVMSIDISNPAAPVLGSVLFGSSDPNAGTTQFGATIVNSQIAYIASSTDSGGSTTDGVGRVLVVNYSNVDDIQNLGEVDIPGTFQIVDVAVQGNRALVVGRTGGTDTYGVNGSMTLSVLDITDPTNPTLLGSTLVTQANFPTGGSGYKISAQPIGSGLFAVSEADVNGNSELMVVDPSDPSSIVASYIPVTSLVNEMTVSGDLLYTTSAQGLTIYNIGTLESIPVTVSVQVPTNVAATIVPNSFNIAPSQIIAGTNFETLVWSTTLAYGDPAPTYTWQSTLSNLAVGQVVPITSGAQVSFTSLSTPGSFQIPGTSVTGTSIVSVTPESQTMQPGSSAMYDVRLSNPTGSPVDYYLGLGGVPGTFQDYPGYVQVPANATIDLPLQVTSSVYDALGDTPFTVYVSSSNGSSGTAQGDRIEAGPPAILPDPNSYGVVASLTPPQATVGQGDLTQFTLQLTNTGSVAEQFHPQVSGFPYGIFPSFSQYDYSVLPGASNTVNVPLAISINSGITPGNYPFTVTVTSQDGKASTTVDGTLVVAPQGVYVSLTPSPITQGGTVYLYVYNQGSATDTYNLSLGGPASVAATLNSTTVTLAPNSSQSIPISIGSYDFADAGALLLVATATSQANPAVTASGSAPVVIPKTTGLSTNFTPASATLPTPAPAAFVLEINNLGNSIDSYSATITGTTGGISASLIGADGQPTQSIPLIKLPGLATGDLQLDTNLTTVGTGTVTVTVTDANGLVSSSTLTVTVPSQASPMTTTTVSSDHPSGSMYGQSVQFSATITGGLSGTPTGTVQFEIDGVDTGSPVALVAGVATFSTTGLSAGDHTITAVYTSDNPNFANSQNDATEDVSRAALTVTATSTTKVYGDVLPTLAFTTSALFNGDTAMTAFTGSLATTAMQSSPVNSYPITQGSLSAANYTITFVAGTLQVTQAPLTVTVTSTTKPYGAALPTLAYTTSAFVNGDKAMTALTGSLATTATQSSAVNSYPITQGSLSAANYAISFVAGTLSVTPVPLTLTADNKTKTAGTANPPLTFSSSGFVNGDGPGSLTTQPTLSTTATTSSGVGGYPITITGAVDPNYTIGYVNGTLAVTAAGTATKTTLTSCANPATYGQNVIFTATVTSTTKNSKPTGTVTFYDGNALLGTGTLRGSDGSEQATFSTSSLTVGSHSITAVYSGGSGLASSTSNILAQVVKQVATCTTLACTGKSPVVGQAVTLSATVAPTSGSGIPTGTVTFMDGSNVLGTGTTSTSSGKLVASFTTTTLAIGSHSITAVYGGDSNELGSKSSALSISIGKDATTTTLASNFNPASAGQSVTFTAKIAVVSPGTGIAAGTVTFRNGSATLQSVTVQVVGGVAEATYTTSNLSAGRHTITAVYSGNGTYAGSTSAYLTETVNTSSKIKPATANPLDVNQDGVVSPLDALMIINELDLQSSGAVIPAATLANCDVNGDGVLTALDALQVINYLAQFGPSGDQATSAVASPAAASPAVATAGVAPVSASVAASTASAGAQAANATPTLASEDIAFAVSVAQSASAQSAQQRSVDGVFASYPESID